MIAKRTKKQLEGFEVTVVCWNCEKDVDEWVVIYPPGKDDGIRICVDCSKIIGEHANQLVK